MIKFIFLALLVAGCTTLANVNYSKYNSYTFDSVGNRQFQDIGHVSASAWGFSKSCDELANQAMSNLLDQAKGLGGNAVYNVRFHQINTFSDSLNPVCKSFFFIAHKVDVKGMAAKIIDQ
jgi:uncharacterized protein YbjQ (UPF0145 family)